MEHDLRYDDPCNGIDTMGENEGMTDNEPTGQNSIELAYASLAAFANEGHLDQGELDSLLKLALRDGAIDEAEKAVLRGVFNRILEEDVSAELWSHIQDVRQAHAI